jgi:hypothetical protein
MSRGEVVENRAPVRPCSFKEPLTAALEVESPEIGGHFLELQAQLPTAAALVA